MGTERLEFPPLVGRLCLLFGLFTLTNCQSKSAIETGGETHFLKSCSPEDDTCGDHLSCVCGVCTVLCDDAQACSVFPGAACVDPVVAHNCGDKVTKRRCDVECSIEDDCRVVSPFHVCLDGICRTVSPPTPPPEPTVKEEAGPATSESNGTPSVDPAPSTAAPSTEPPDAAPMCTSGEVSPNEVLIMGDSFFGITHQFTAFLEDLARGSGALAEGERYRDGSRAVANALGNDQILDQYLTAAADNPVRVAVTTGGGADILAAMCSAPFDDCQILLDARNGAERLFGAMAEGGVSDVVYVYYPDPLNPDIQAKVDFLRPLLETECSEAPVTCHWVDLRPTFEGNDDTYVGADGITPTAVGSKAAAEVVWAVMQSQCIAQ